MCYTTYHINSRKHVLHYIFLKKAELIAKIWLPLYFYYNSRLENLQKNPEWASAMCCVMPIRGPVD